MIRRPATAALSLLLLLGGGCASTPVAPADAAQLVAAAEAEVQAGNYGGAFRALSPVSDEACPKHLQDRRDLARARAEVGVGELWESYLVLERFSDDHPLSDLRPQVMELLWTIGNQLLARDSSAVFFWSDRGAARIVLEHLITRHPDTQRLADALRILGDMAFEDGDYEVAQTRYREIILERPDSDWRFYANFRFAMSIVAGLRGSDYDLDGMRHAATELRTFLRTAPENPQMLAEAQRALQQVLAWQVQRHLDVVDYYKTLDNFDGQLHHARMATREEFREVSGYEEAVAVRERLEAARAAAEAAVPAGGAR